MVDAASSLFDSIKSRPRGVSGHARAFHAKPPLDRPVDEEGCHGEKKSETIFSSSLGLPAHRSGSAPRPSSTKTNSQHPLAGAPSLRAALLSIVGAPAMRSRGLLRVSATKSQTLGGLLAERHGGGDETRCRSEKPPLVPSPCCLDLRALHAYR